MKWAFFVAQPPFFGGLMVMAMVVVVVVVAVVVYVLFLFISSPAWWLREALLLGQSRIAFTYIKKMRCGNQAEQGGW